MLPKAKKTLRTAAPAAAAVSTKTPMESNDVAHENLEAVWPQYEIGHILTRGNIALQKTENQHCKLMSVCAANYYIERYCHFFPSTQNSPRKLLERPGRSQVENTKASKIPRPTKALTVGTGRVG